MIRTLHVKILIFLSILVSFVFTAIGQVSVDEYYQNATGKTGGELKTALHFIISKHTILPYTSDEYDVWDALKQTDEDPNDPTKVLLIYSGRSELKTHQDNGTGDSNSWNREHIWAKSHGFGGNPIDNPGAATDIHHLRACDRSVNSDRSNLFFDNGGEANNEATKCNYDNDSWEPRDAIKGDVARMIFYMTVCYEGENGNPDLEMTNNMTYSQIDPSKPYFGKLSTLISWNSQDPVDATERARNEKVYKIQGNRNPFIDHSEWVNSIWVDTDSNSPEIVRYNPESGSTTVLPTDNLILTFNEEVQEGTGTISIKNFEDNSEFETLDVVNNPRVKFTNNTVLIDPSSIFEEGSKYYITFTSGAIIDASSNIFDGFSDKTIWNFTATYTPPVISNFTPTTNSVNIPIDTELKITFNKSMQAGNGNISIQPNNGKVINILASTTTINEEIVTIQLPKELESSTEYFVLIDENAFVSDNGIAFKGITSDEDWRFTTEVITGIDNLSAKDTPSFYPNPATSDIRLTNINNIQSMYISNLTGRKIIEIKYPNAIISINNLPKGMYFVTFITNTDNRVTKKLMKR